MHNGDMKVMMWWMDLRHVHVAIDDLLTITIVVNCDANVMYYT